MTSLKKALFVILSVISFSAIAWQPNKPIEVTVPFPPGSGNDVVIRPLAAVVEKNTGAKFLITNKPGAGGTVGTAGFVSKPNDGYHINIISVPGVAAMDYTWLAQLSKQPYSVKSFTYATALAQSPLVFIANKNDPVSNLEGLTNILIHDKTVTVAHSGAANSLALEALLLRLDTAKKNPSLVKIEHKGPAESLSDVMGGHVRFAVMPLSVAYANAKAGNIKIVYTSKDVNLVWGITLPKDTPADVLDWYAKVFKEAQNDPTVKESFEKNKYSPVDGLQTPEAFTAYVMGQSKQHAKTVDIIIKNQKAGGK